MPIAKKMSGIRFSDEEREKLEKEAQQLGMSFSEYVRFRVTESSQLERIEKKIDSIAEKLDKTPGKPKK